MVADYKQGEGYQLKTIAARGVDFEVGAKLFQTSDP